MGVSSDGMLYFGFEVGEEDQKPDWLEDYDDLDDFIVAKSGLPDDAPYEARRKVIEACPAELQLYCSYDCPMYILGVRGAEHCVSRGYTEEINIRSLAVDPDKIHALKAWCDQHGIEWQQPKWLLCSMYG